MGNEPIVMPNEGSQRVEFCPRWNWPNGSVSYGPMFTDHAVVQAFLDKPPVGVLAGVMQHRRVHTTPWGDADLPEALAGTPFLIGIGTSSGPLHAVETRHWNSTRRHVPTVCGKPAIIARDWGGFAR